MTDTPKPDPNTPPLFWRPCMKRPVVVHVRDATPGEEVFTREGLTIANGDDLVMRGIDGEVYPIGRSIFERTYDLLPEGAAVVADSPELAQARADASRRLAERDEERAIIDGLRAALGLKPGVGLAALTAVARDKFSEDDMESADAIDGLVRESLELRALAEDELAQARERIAALEDMWSAATAAMEKFLIERDAALARVRELEAERALLRGVCTGNAKTITELGAMAAAQPKPRDESVPPPGHWEPAGADRWRTFGPDGATLCMVYPTYGASEVMYAITVDGCGAYSDPTTAMRMADLCIARARRGALPDEAAAQPKPRDESVPPPGWEWDNEDDDPDEVTVDSRGVRWVLREGQQPLDKAWSIYDAEHAGGCSRCGGR